jgi:hypothetical protein
VSQMLLAGFWFVTGVVYVLFCVFNVIFARRMELIDVPAITKYDTDYFSDEEIEKAKLEHNSLLMEKQQLVNEGKITNEDWGYWKEFCSTPYGIEAQKKEKLNLNKAFKSIEKVAKEYNGATKINRGVLRVAAISFFLAAIISFIQSVLSVYS